MELVSRFFQTAGGDAKLLVMLCVSPAQRFVTETLQCLGFGSRARQVARGQTKKRRPTSFVPSNLSIGMYSDVFWTQTFFLLPLKPHYHYAKRYDFPMVMKS